MVIKISVILTLYENKHFTFSGLRTERGLYFTSRGEQRIDDKPHCNAQATSGTLKCEIQRTHNLYSTSAQSSFNDLE